MILSTELEQKGNQFPSKIVSYKKDVDTLYFTTENFVVLQVTVRRDSVIRFRYSTKTIFPKDFSYAITKYASSGFNHLSIEEEKEHYVITTSKLIINLGASSPSWTRLRMPFTSASRIGIGRPCGPRNPVTRLIELIRWYPSSDISM